MVGSKFLFGVHEPHLHLDLVIWELGSTPHGFKADGDCTSRNIVICV